MGATEILDGNIPIKAKAAAWLINQGVTVVLLFLMLFGIYIRTPELLSQVQRGYIENSEQLEKTAVLYQRNTDKILELLERAQQNRSLVKPAPDP